MERNISWYLNREIDKIMTESRAEYDTMSKESAELIWDEFLVKRNIRMIDAAIPLMEKNNGGVFIAVGMAHLPGLGGMVDLFKKEGFTVTPIIEKQEESRF